MAREAQISAHNVQRRLRRDRLFGRLLAGAAIASAAALLAMVLFLAAGALPLFDWRGPSLRLLERSALAQAPQRIALDARGKVLLDYPADAKVDPQLLSALVPLTPGLAPWCAATSAQSTCYVVGERELTVSLRASDCVDCPVSELNQARLEGGPWTAATLVGDGRSGLLVAGSSPVAVAPAVAEFSWLYPYRDQQGQLQLGEHRWQSPGALVAALQRLGGSDLALAVGVDGSVALVDASAQRCFPLLPAGAIDAVAGRIYVGADQLVHWREGELSRYAFERIDRPALAALWRPSPRAGQDLHRSISQQSIWQPHADDADGAPRMNLLPLLLGSLKAALLGLLFGAPLAIAAAMHSVQYRSAAWRDGLKSSFELMEAVPTVILGLIAGLWIAPWLDRHLGLAIGAALGWLLAFALPWPRLKAEPEDRRRALHALLRCAAGLLLGGVLGGTVEGQLPTAQLTGWLGSRWGWHYEPYNGMVVGMLVGLAIAPMIYSLAEESLRSAPAGLQEAAVALGASRRDTLFGLLLPAALPGIVAASLMGLGRALGETLIVLLASNNAPMADLNPLTGLRSIAATLVLEAPTAVPGSLHYRVLLLATLLLMLLTIGLNLLANRWRRRMTQKRQTLEAHR